MLGIFLHGLLAGQDSLLLRAENNLYSDKDSALYYLQAHFKKSKDSGNLKGMVEALDYMNFLGNYHHDLPLLSTSLKQQDSLFSNVDVKGIEDETYFVISRWYNKGAYYHKLQDFGTAAVNFYKIIRYLEGSGEKQQTEFAEFMTATYSHLALMFKNQFKFEVAEEFYMEALRVARESELPEEDLLDYYNLLADLKAEQGEVPVSSGYARKSMAFYQVNGPEKSLNSFVSTALLLANNYLLLNQPDSSSYYLELAAPFIVRQQRFEQAFIRTRADLQLMRGDTLHALEVLQVSKQNLRNKGGSGDQLAEIDARLASIYLYADQLPEAVDAYLEALSYYGYPDTDPYMPKTPGAGNRFEVFPLIRGLNSALNSTAEVNGYLRSLKFTRQALQELDTLKRSFYSEADRLLLTENILPIIETGIEACYALSRQPTNAAYIDTAFYLFERSKSPVLLEALNSNTATSYSGIPAEILEKEKLLRVQISETEARINLQKDTLLQSSLFQLRRRHETILATMEMEFPEYYRLKYREEMVSLGSMERELDDDGKLISYYFGKKVLYWIETGQGTTHMSRLTDTGKLTQVTEAILAGLMDPRSPLDTLQQQLRDLHHLLFPMGLKLPEESTLYVIPDGPLRLLPFESLLDGDTYLIERSEVVYLNSATVYKQLKDRKYRNTRLLGLAPEFTSATSEFSSLPNSERELSLISQHFNGEYLVGAQASLKAFEHHLPDYGMIHLATHARVNHEFPDYSFLAFSADKENPVKLFQNDLYNLHFEAALVTLSACETGTGKLIEGEGLMSLSRSIFYAGAKSLFTSLWKVSDQATTEIMDVFYENLSQGKTKSSAARMSKTAFIAHHRDDPMVHPNYWAGFVLYGDPSPVNTSWDIKWGLLAMIILISLFLLFRRVRQLLQ